MSHTQRRGELERQLYEALGKNDYALAAQIRDELAAMGFNVRTKPKQVGQWRTAAGTPALIRKD